MKNNRIVTFFAIIMMLFLINNNQSFANGINLGGNSSSSSDASSDSSAISTADSMNSQTTDLNMFNNSFNSEGKRGFLIPGDMNYPQLIPFYGKERFSSSFQPIEQIITYTQYFSEGALENMANGEFNGTKVEFKIVNDVKKPAKPIRGKRWIKIVLSTQAIDHDLFVGYVTAKAKKIDTTMVEVLGKAALKCLKSGCNVIQIIAQGVNADVFSKGWGIGFNSVQGQVYDNQDRSNVSSGGTGYSSAIAGMRTKPWLQAYGLVDYSLNVPGTKYIDIQK